MRATIWFVAVGFCLVAVPAQAVDVLLIPDWTGDRVAAFSPSDGSLIDADFIPDDGRLNSPKNAIDSSRGTVFVSDQLTDGVFEYDLDGNYIQTVVDNANHGIDNIRGIAVRDGHLYVTVASGTHSNTIQRFDLNGGDQTTWANVNVASPFDVFFRANDALVAAINTDNIERYGFDGTWLDTFHDSDGVSGVDFPEQIIHSIAGGGGVYVAGFSAPTGIFEYDANGAQVNLFATSSGLRGVYPLDNGLLLFTSGSEVSTYDPATGDIVVIMTGINAQYIERVPEPATALLLGVGGLLLLRRRK
jgi:hypothetical protein